MGSCLNTEVISRVVVQDLEPLQPTCIDTKKGTIILQIVPLMKVIGYTSNDLLF